ncbi:MAG: S1/P1 nuclease [Gammaproteobacteria bacterium]
MIRFIQFFSTLLLCFFCFPLFAWDATGHRLVAQIAFDRLTPSAKERVNAILGLQPNDLRSDRFLEAAVWADNIKKQHNFKYNRLHYTNIPFTFDQTPLPNFSSPNIMTAIDDLRIKLSDSNLSKVKQKLYLRLLIHFVGDIHQPLHCATRVSRSLPLGDEGGNLFLVKGMHVKNLHALWDQGIDHYSYITDKYPLRHWQIKELAKKLEHDFPRENYIERLQNTTPKLWAQESFMRAKNTAYQIPAEQFPEQKYLQEASVMSKEQIALAGYRLSVILNQLYGSK